MVAFSVLKADPTYHILTCVQSGIDILSAHSEAVAKVVLVLVSFPWMRDREAHSVARGKVAVVSFRRTEIKTTSLTFLYFFCY